MRFNIGNGSLWLGDCLDLMREIPNGSVDMVLCDLPYGTTACKWDTIIPFEPLWEQYWRVVKPNAAIVLTAAQPFTSALVMSQVDFFRYDWTWKKEKGTGHLNAKKMPMRDKEDVLVFYREQCVYNPQFSEGKPYNGTARVGKKQQADVYGKHGNAREDNPGIRYPKQVIEFTSAGRSGNLHPTQKPVDLFEYFIKTYTNPGDLVLDNCSGSGTTAIAAERTGRRWLCMEKELQYYLAASGRIYGEVA